MFRSSYLTSVGSRGTSKIKKMVAKKNTSPNEDSNLVKPEDVLSIEQLEAEVGKVLLIQDLGLVRMVCATVIANRLTFDPVWLLLVAPPSGGKTELIAAISGLDFVHMISDLTVNTFASGQKKTGKETSLLLKMNNGIMAFKDFTSVLSKNKDAKKEIMGQLREIYDGEYVKRTGTGDDITWRGKIGAIAGCTEIIYRHLEEMSAMGDRFIMYNIEQPDRIEVTRRALDNAQDMSGKREHLKQCFSNYIKHVIKNLNEDEIELDQEVKDELITVSDFATRVRSAVLTDFKSGLVDFVPAAEMPMRMIAQLFSLASAFIGMDKSSPFDKNKSVPQGKLSALQRRLLYKTAFDSVPRTRRDALLPLATYRDGLSTAGLAVKLELPTDSVKKYLAQLNALGICSRHKQGGAQGDVWKIKDEYRKILVELYGIKVIEGTLLAENVSEIDGDVYDELDEYDMGIANEKLDDTL